MNKYWLYIICSCLYVCLPSQAKAQELNELLVLFEDAQQEDVRADYALKIARAYYAGRQVENSLKYYSKVENIERKKNNKNNLATIYEEMGSVYQSWQGYDKSMYYFGEANKIYESQRNLMGQKTCLRQMAWSSFQLGQYTEAQKYYDALLKIHQNEGNKTQQADIYTRLAVIAEIRKLYPEAIAYSEKALAIQQANQEKENTAKTFNNLGVLHRKQGEPKKSINYFHQAIDLYKAQITQTNNTDRKAQLYSNIGVVYTNMRDFDTALQFQEQALALREKQNEPSKIATVQNEIATNQYLNSNNERGKYFANRAISKAEPINDWEALADSYLVLSNIYKSEGDLKEYETYTKLYTKAQRELDKKASQREQELLNKKFAVQTFETGLKIANTEEEKQKLEKKAAEDAVKISKAEAERQKAEADAQRKEAEIQRQQANSQRLEAERARAIANAAERDRQLALAKEREAQQDKELALSKASEEKALKGRAEAEKAKAIAEADQLKKDRARILAEQQGRNQLYLFSAIIAFIALILIFIIISYIRNRQKNRLLQAQNDKIKEQNVSLEQQKEEIEAQRDAIGEEQKKSDTLLLNILPFEVAKELKEKGYATPKYYESATVLFTDFKGFTNAAAKMTPQEVIKALDVCFLAFDEISEKYGLEKIKTIGDAYMCAGGIPLMNQTHPLDAVKAGLEIKQFMDKMRQEREAKGEPYWELRIGVNTGALVAGVVGKNKFAYDIWGDAVNLASRMESSGEPGKVNISGFTYELIKDYVDVTYRGKVPAKNKGDVDMYFVDRLK